MTVSGAAQYDWYTLVQYTRWLAERGLIAMDTYPGHPDESHREFVRQFLVYHHALDSDG